MTLLLKKIKEKDRSDVESRENLNFCEETTLKLLFVLILTPFFRLPFHEVITLRAWKKKFWLFFNCFLAQSIK